MVEKVVSCVKDEAKNERARTGRARQVFNRWKGRIIVGALGLSLMGSAAALHGCTKQPVEQAQKEKSKPKLTPEEQHRLNDELLDAALHGKTEEVRELVKKGAYVNAKRSAEEHEFENTPLMNAVLFTANLEIVKFLVEMGADVNAKNQFGETALMLAAGYGFNTVQELTASEKRDYAEITKLLINKKADVNARDYAGETPLSSAAYVAGPEIAGLLLNGGADIDTKNDFGWTPLMQGAYAGNAKMVEFLLDKGANINVEDEDGDTALTMAEKGRQQWTTWLRNTKTDEDRNYLRSRILRCDDTIKVLEIYKAESWVSLFQTI